MAAEDEYEGGPDQLDLGFVGGVRNVVVADVDHEGQAIRLGRAVGRAVVRVDEDFPDVELGGGRAGAQAEGRRRQRHECASEGVFHVVPFRDPPPRCAVGLSLKSGSRIPGV